MKKKVVSVLLSSVMAMSVFAGVATQVSARSEEHTSELQSLV